MPSSAETFALPIGLDLTAVAIFALSGAGEAIRRGYDLVGILALAMVTAIGGSLLRDTLLGTLPPPFFLDSRYLMAIGVGALAALPFYRLISRLATPLLTIDALGLAAYTIVGAQKALAAGVSTPAIILIGVINGVGGSILRDVLTRQEPLLFRPGQYYALASLLGSALYVSLRDLHFSLGLSAALGIATICLTRLAAVKFNWRTHAPLAPGARSVLHSGPHR